MFKYTKKRSGYYKLLVDGVEVSQHSDAMEAVENGGAALVANPAAQVRVIHDYELWIEWEEQPQAVTDWAQVVNLTIGPHETAVLNSASTVNLKIETV